MNLNNLTKQYINFLPCSERNIKIIEHYFDLTRALSPDQKKLLKSVVRNKKTSIYKHRRMGATTAIDAFLSVEVFMAEEPINIVVMCPYMIMCEEHRRNFIRFLTQMPISLNDSFNDEKIFDTCRPDEIRLKNGSRIIFTVPKVDKLCGLNIDYMVFDECNLLDNSLLSYTIATENSKHGKIVSINTDFMDLSQ